MTTHKFHLGQPVAYNPQNGTWAARGAYIVTATLPERDGEFAYRIRSAMEEHERLAREGELKAMSEVEATSAAQTGKRS